MRPERHNTVKAHTPALADRLAVSIVSEGHAQAGVSDIRPIRADVFHHINLLRPSVLQGQSCPLVDAPIISSFRRL